MQEKQLDTGETNKRVQAYDGIITSCSLDRQPAIKQIDLLITEANTYLEQWQTKLGLLASTQPNADQQLSDPVWEWTSRARDSFFEWYTREIIPARNTHNLGRIVAHGTYLNNLFKNPQKQADSQGVANTKLAQGIISTGIIVGQFGIFEEYKQNDFSKGAWFSNKGTGTIRYMSQGCWILLNYKNVKEQQENTEYRKLNSLTLVFIDPRTYKEYLEELRRRIENREEIIPHVAMRLDQLQYYLQNNQGRFPFEEAA